MLDRNTKYHINPTGRLSLGGPMGDAGVTGRKIIVDANGLLQPSRGGCGFPQGALQGDRSACYMAAVHRQEHCFRGLARRPKCNSRTPLAWPSRFPLWSMAFGPRDSGERINCAGSREFLADGQVIIEAWICARPIYNPPPPWAFWAHCAGASPWERTDRAAALAQGCGLGAMSSAGVEWGEAGLEPRIKFTTITETQNRC